VLEQGNQQIPFGRWGRPYDTADLVEWLASDAGG
jgi:NAD(P)-dependent dehydrogenase (short-subunit alcohol dehydrogenase family)